MADYNMLTSDLTRSIWVRWRLILNRRVSLQQGVIFYADNFTNVHRLVNLHMNTFQIHDDGQDLVHLQGWCW